MKKKAEQLNYALESPNGIQKTLAHLKIKSTRQRNEIARIILSKTQHLSAEQVFFLVNKTGERVSKATVYNTLNLFVKKGLIQQVVIESTKVFYDSNTSFHYHFYNEDSGELSDFVSNDICFEPAPILPKNTVKSGIDVIVRIKNVN